MRQECVGGGAPPPGGFNGIGAKLVILASSVCWFLGNLPRLYRVAGHLPLGGLSLASLASVPTSQVYEFSIAKFVRAPSEVAPLQAVLLAKKRNFEIKKCR